MKPKADLVLEGGGVKGLGTAGAVIRLLEGGYTFPRLAGTSVGAVAAAVAAVCADADEVREVMGTLDLRRVPDRALGAVPFVSEAVSLLLGRGAYAGDYLRIWLSEMLRERGVETFAQLRRKDRGDDAHLPVSQRYRLVVMATDVTRGRLLRLPWDYHLFDLDPDEQLVADAVRMSLSIPFYFRPCTLTHRTSGLTSVIVDGGVLSNFPIEVFDRTDGKRSRWPTIGVRLIPDLPAGLSEFLPFLGGPTPPLLELLEQVVATALVGRDQTHLDRPGVRDRTIPVDTSGVGITNFHIGDAARAALVAQGHTAADTFLAGISESREGAVP